MPKQQDVKDWIKKSYLDVQTIKGLQRSFADAKPFRHLVLPFFLHEPKAMDVLAHLGEEEFIPKESDLFKIKQTADLASTRDRFLANVRTFLCSESFVSYMEQLTGLALRPGIVDLHGSLYEDTDFLLCHDDQLDDRKIAFLLYLSDFEEGDGGSLNLFAVNDADALPSSVVKKIIPRFNTLAFFEVSPISFHEVEEVVVDKQRIALGGWLYGR